EGYTPPGKDVQLYSSHRLFPSSWFSYNVGCGLNGQMDHVTHVTVSLYPVRYLPGDALLYVAEGADVRVTFDPPVVTLPTVDTYDLAIIAPQTFASELQPLVEHKERMGLATVLKTTEDIYSQYDGVDRPEQIKYFIKDAIEEWGASYVLLVGGLKSIFYAKPRDHPNYGVQGWHVPVRYSNLVSGEPGYPCDLYYADVYKAGGVFEDWDSNGNGIFAEWTDETGAPEDVMDLYPDVALGRLACRSVQEVRDVVNKIIAYETTSYSSDWFERMLVVSGDGFLDQHDLDFQWDTTGLPEGEYTIYAQSTNDQGVTGPADVINVTLDRGASTSLRFNHDDHLNPALQDGYPAPPITEIVSVSEGDVLGSDDYHYEPSEREAYCNTLFWWANVSYADGVLHIRGKSYDPQPYGNVTDVHLWIENSNGEVVFEDYRYHTEVYYEGEWVTGEKSLHGRGGALHYMPERFERDIVWTSNGRFTGQRDVIEAFSRGHGFAFFSGHGSPGYWGDQYPGIPGNRQYGSVDGLTVTQVSPFFPWVQFPAFPMKQLANTGQYPVVVVGGCHNSQFNISLIPSVLDIFFLLLLGKNLYMHTYGQPTPECWGWYMVKMPESGAIATMGNTGYGWGWEGEYCTVGAGDGWITSEFFRQYAEHGYGILGTAYTQTQTSYISHFKSFTLPECWWFPDLGWDAIDEKTVQQWVLLGDPSLQMGGYPQ
ncbi:MAG TPA: peptidase C25, partial [Thermoplasmatales archaeon]|nr:peptidase C25 [Thermoplasmatales archaeon]